MQCPPPEWMNFGSFFYPCTCQNGHFSETFLGDLFLDPPTECFPVKIVSKNPTLDPPKNKNKNPPWDFQQRNQKRGPGSYLGGRGFHQHSPNCHLLTFRHPPAHPRRVPAVPPWPQPAGRTSSSASPPSPAKWRRCSSTPRRLSHRPPLICAWAADVTPPFKDPSHPNSIITRGPPITV